MASKKGPPPVVYVVLGIILIVGGYQLIPIITEYFRGGSPSIIEPTKKQDRELTRRFSTGDKALIETSAENQAFVQSKQKGLQAMATGNYPQAVQHFEHTGLPPLAERIKYQLLRLKSQS